MSGVGPSIVHASVPHTLNVLVHVIFGTAALLAGLVPIFVTKGGRTHRRFGRYFLVCLAALVATATIGLFVFNFRAFLAVITLLAAWAPVVIYSTLGALVFMASYDLVRLTFPHAWYAHLWLHEHLIKMLGAYTAVLSAFAGTVLVRWQPYSQIVPAALTTSAMIGFSVQLARRQRGGGESGTPPTAAPWPNIIPAHD